MFYRAHLINHICPECIDLCRTKSNQIDPLFFLKNEKASKNFASLKCHSTELEFALSLENLLYIVSSPFLWFNWWSTILSHTIKSLGENHGQLRTGLEMKSILDQSRKDANPNSRLIYWQIWWDWWYFFKAIN